MRKIFLLLVLCFCGPVAGETVVWSSDITLSDGEVAFAAANSPASIKSSLGTDPDSRYDFLVSLVVSKKISESLSQMDPKQDPATYYAYVFALLEAAREFDQKVFQRDLELPDFTALAMERYRVSRNVIASVPEIRNASHILLLCGDSCDEDAVREETEALRQRALAGEAFDELAVEYSQDPGSKTRGGLLSMGIQQDAENVDQSFRDELFSLTNVGDISEVVKSRFGFHIIRLEGVTEPRIRSFEEVEGQLVREIEKRYREDAYQQRIMSLAPREPLEVDSEALDAIMGPLPTESDQ